MRKTAFTIPAHVPESFDVIPLGGKEEEVKLLDLFYRLSQLKTQA